jgi:hypothetical protein
MPKLKVFCTTSGFYDHLVAAPSKPAALKAWGAKTDLFSMGVARLVTDPKIERKALERPGEVIRLRRDGGKKVDSRMPLRTRARKRPSRAKLDAAEERFAELGLRQGKEFRTAQSEVIAAQNKLATLEKRQASARRAAERGVEKARDAYERALAKWDPGS